MTEIQSLVKKAREMAERMRDQYGFQGESRELLLQTADALERLLVENERLKDYEWKYNGLSK